MTAPYGAGQPVGVSPATPATLLGRLRAVQQRLGTIRGAPDVEKRRNRLLREASQITESIQSITAGYYNATALEGYENRVLRLEQATMALAGKAGYPLQGLGAAQGSQQGPKVPPFVWWGGAALVGVALLTWWMRSNARASGGGVSGLGSLHNSTASARGFGDAAPAL